MLPRFLRDKKISFLRDLSISYARLLCNYNNYIIKYKKDLYYSDYRNKGFRRFTLNHFLENKKGYEQLLKKEKDSFIWQFLVEFRNFDNSTQTLKTFKDFEYEKYKLESLRKAINYFYISNKDVGGMSKDCLDLLDNMIYILSEEMREIERSCYIQSDNFNSSLDIKYQLENSSLDKDEVRLSSVDEAIREFEINQYW